MRGLVPVSGTRFAVCFQSTRPCEAKSRVGIPKEKAMVNIHKYGNTTAATIPSCLTEYYREGKLKKGDNLILAAFGAGFTWGSIFLTWGMD